MCFSPQRRAFCQHLNFEKCSRTLSFLTFWLQNVLFATAACIFSTSELQKVLPDHQFFNIFTSTCLSRHSGVHFFDILTYKSAPNTSCFAHVHFQMCFSPQRRAILISPLTTWLRTRRFNRPTFGLTLLTDHRENTAFRDFSNIWRGCIFFLLTFALLHLLSADLTACLIRFSTVHIVGSFYLNFLRLIIHLCSIVSIISVIWYGHEI